MFLNEAERQFALNAALDVLAGWTENDSIGDRFIEDFNRLYGPVQHPTKHCVRCHREYPESSLSGDGFSVPTRWCHECLSAYQPKVDASEGTGGIGALTEMMVRVGVDAFKSATAPPVSSAAFEAALDELEDAVRHHLFNAQSTARRVAARAEVLRMHQEVVDDAK